MRARIRRFLLWEEGNRGGWRFNGRNSGAAPDADTTACAAAAVLQAPRRKPHPRHRTHGGLLRKHLTAGNGGDGDVITQVNTLRCLALIGEPVDDVVDGVLTALRGAGETGAGGPLRASARAGVLRRARLGARRPAGACRDRGAARAARPRVPRGTGKRRPSRRGARAERAPRPRIQRSGNDRRRRSTCSTARCRAAGGPTPRSWRTAAARRPCRRPARCPPWPARVSRDDHARNHRGSATGSSPASSANRATRRSVSWRRMARRSSSTAVRSRRRWSMPATACATMSPRSPATMSSATP